MVPENENKSSIGTSGGELPSCGKLLKLTNELGRQSTYIILTALTL